MFPFLENGMIIYTHFPNQTSRGSPKFLGSKVPMSNHQIGLNISLNMSQIYFPITPHTCDLFPYQ